MKNNLIFIPGLGFDERIFSNLKIQNSNLHYLNWKEPRHKEHLNDYAFRISEWMEELNPSPILIGHSFGGVLAQEIAQIRPVKKIILISSIKSRDELPGVFRAVNWFGLHSLFSKKRTFSTFNLWAKKHAYDTAKKQALFKSMVGNQSDKLLQWSLKNLCAWQGTYDFKIPLIQIHGTRDLTFPYSLIQSPDHSIEKGTHMMVFDQAEKMSEIISAEISR